ncbi:MAG: glycosyltransferase family 1 protein, partial [Candidatus Hydrothermae bacterium]|nr:glycosyltransferase family 1 protein [Candidatus Hydrothermae bacterium]
MKVAVVASFARSLVIFRGHLLQTLVQRGHRVVALAPDFTEDLRAVLHTWGVQPVAYPLVRQGTSVQEDAAAYLALLRHFQHLQPDVV